MSELIKKTNIWWINILILLGYYFVTKLTNTESELLPIAFFLHAVILFSIAGLTFIHGLTHKTPTRAWQYVLFGIFIGAFELARYIGDCGAYCIG